MTPDQCNQERFMMAVLRKMLCAVPATVLTFVALPTFAQDAGSGFYVRLFGGASFLADTDLSGAANTSSVGFDTGPVAGAAFGYDYLEGPFRSEFEFAYRSGEANGDGGVTGDFASTTVALNGYYDFAPSGQAGITPYLGAGVAYITEIDFDLTAGGTAGEYNDRGKFGYQLMGGVSYPVSDRWSLNGEVRYFDGGSQDLSSNGKTLSADYGVVDLIFGATVRF